MAKKSVASLQKGGGKQHSKVIKMVLMKGYILKKN